MIKPREAVNNTTPNPYATAFNNISNQPVNNSPNLDKDSDSIDYSNETELYHNTIITLYTKNQNSRKYVRFVFMTDFSILKHSAICLLNLTLTWQSSVAAETLKIVKSYDENNTKHQVEAVIEFKVLDENNKLKQELNKEDIELKSNGKLVENFRLIKPDEKNQTLIILLFC